MNCSEARPLIDAYADGEVDGLRKYRVGRHLRHCAHCAEQHRRQVATTADMRHGLPYFTAPVALRERVAALARPNDDAGTLASRPERTSAPWTWFAAGTAAGCILTAVTWLGASAVLDARAHEQFAVAAVSAHVRATLGTHAVDVASSEQHTVKPWLSARLDYSPPVRDFAAEGFPLVGGRIDYVEHRRVAVLVYRRREHTIDVFVRPAEGASPPASTVNVRGFNVVRASRADMNWIAVSDLNAEELAAFVARLGSVDATK